MFGAFGKNDRPNLDKPIDRVLSEMEEHGPDSPEYPSLLTHLERLMKLQRGDSRSPLSLDTLATVAGNVLGILVIVAYEQNHVMSSKGLGFIGKPK